ncbi:MAG: exo-beta-N-acetylmuramidase NamZ domain-containing protein [Candidatus Zixiibacteriota bacterium]
MKQIFCGIDIAKKEKPFKNHNIAILCHPASVDKELNHILDIDFDANLKAIFTPQHGLFGHTQANMIEWEGGFIHPKYHVPVYSLYGKTRKPTFDMFAGIDIMIIDLFDIGARYYTYIWTAMLAMEAANEAEIPVMVLDRPNPIGGKQISGPILQKGFESFVGLFALPIRHGMTIGEIMKMIHSEMDYTNRLEIVGSIGFKRGYFDEHDFPWIMPSPNMPTLDTAIVYPGQCLLEVTNISEGRGTTRPFELFGAPFIDSDKMIDLLDIPGAILRPVSYMPTFDKYDSELVNGAQIHVIDRDLFDPVYATWEILRIIRKLYPDEFKWLKPPYEYEYEKLPIEILLGGNDYLKLLESDLPYLKARKRWKKKSLDFSEKRQKYLIY